MNKRMDIRTTSFLQCLHISGLWHKILQSGHSKHQKFPLSLEVRSPKSRCPTDNSKGSRGESFLLLPTPRASRHSLACGCTTPTSTRSLFPVCLCPNFPLVIKTLVILNQGPQTVA